MTIRTALLAATVLSLAGCTLFLAGDPALRLCDTDPECGADERCVSGFCKAGAGDDGGDNVAEGEGAAEGEPAGEGEVEGEGEGEGEGVEGEGEGEGEVVAGEGEGEGEPPPPPPPPPPRTCREAAQAGATSGVTAVDLDRNGVVAGDEATVFCEQDREGGGWTRLLLLDSTAAGFACPAGFLLVNGAGFRGCARPDSAVPTGSVSSLGVPALHDYSEVLGTITGVVFGDQDAFAAHEGAGINGIYVDGVSLTVGAPREHLFTFVGAHPCYSGAVRCPCDGGAAAPGFVDDSFCDNPSQAARPQGCADSARAFDGATPLWDGPTDQCTADADGFFVRATRTAHVAADAIELRLMADQETTDENLALTRVELYIR